MVDKNIEEVMKYVVEGQYFKAETVKGNFTYIRLSKITPDRQNVFFIHAGYNKITGGPKVTKHLMSETFRAIESGDIEPVKRGDVDIQRFIPASMGLTALSKGMKGEQYLDELAKKNSNF